MTDRRLTGSRDLVAFVDDQHALPRGGRPVGLAHRLRRTGKSKRSVLARRRGCRDGDGNGHGEGGRADVCETVGEICHMPRPRPIEERPAQLVQQRLPQHSPQRLDRLDGRFGVPGTGERSQPAGRGEVLATVRGAASRHALELDVRGKRTNRLGAQRRPLTRQALQGKLADPLERAREDQRDRPASRQLISAREQGIDRGLGDRLRARSGMQGASAAHVR